MKNMEKGFTPEPEQVEEVLEETTEETTEELKKYSDSDVDEIVKKRLARERKRVARELEQREELSELELRERKVERREMEADARMKLSEEGLPVSLSSILNYNSREEFEAGLEILTGEFKRLLGEEVQRSIKNALKGENPRKGCGSIVDRSIADAFAK